MEDYAKIKINIKNINIELEGNQEFVKDLFCNLTQLGLGKLEEYSKDNYIMPFDKYKDSDNIECNVKSDRKDVDNEQFPSLKDAILRNYAVGEPQWCLLYGYYLLREGKEFFTKEDLKQKYEESGRMTETRKKNFSTNVKACVRKGWFSYKDNRFLFLTKDAKSFVERHMLIKNN